jgi:hypothetical protein
LSQHHFIHHNRHCAKPWLGLNWLRLGLNGGLLEWWCCAFWSRNNETEKVQFYWSMQTSRMCSVHLDILNGPACFEYLLSRNEDERKFCLSASLLYLFIRNWFLRG